MDISFYLLVKRRLNYFPHLELNHARRGVKWKLNCRVGDFDGNRIFYPSVVVWESIKSSGESIRVTTCRIKITQSALAAVCEPSHGTKAKKYQTLARSKESRKKEFGVINL